MPEPISFRTIGKVKVTNVLAASLGAAALLLMGAGNGHAATFTPIVDPANSTFTQALGINNSGTIVGYGNLTTNDGFQLTLPAIPANFSRQNAPGADGGTQVIGISGTGITVGFSVTANITSGFVHSGNDFINKNDPEASFTQLLGINNGGSTAVGYSSTDSTGATMQKAILVDLTSNSFTDLNALLPVNYNSQATGVNDSGEVVGFYQSDTTGQLSAFTDIGGSITSFSAFGSHYTQALGVNNHGDIVGSYIIDGITHGFLDQGGIFSVLDVPESTLTVINGINDLGQIVGFYNDADGNTIGVIGEVPEPATLTLLGAALVAMVGVARPRRFRA